MESEFEKISRKTGRKQTACKCEQCKSQCRVSPCLGTPQDIIKLIKAGYKDRLAVTDWLTGFIMKAEPGPVVMLQAIYDEKKKACTFFNNGLCELHDLGLKPTEGKLSHHSTKPDNFDFKKSINYTVAKTWLNITAAEFEEIKALWKK